MWHHCLGHVSYDTIQQMSKDDIIQGMVAASKKYLAFTREDPSAIYESFTPSVLKVM